MHSLRVAPAAHAEIGSHWQTMLPLQMLGRLLFHAAASSMQCGTAESLRPAAPDVVSDLASSVSWRLVVQMLRGVSGGQKKRITAGAPA